MGNERTIGAAGLAAAGVGLAATGTAMAQATGDTTVEDFSSWPGENGLGEYSGAGAFQNGDGEVIDGALRLEYDDGGWFLSVVREDLSAHDALELVVRGDDGGEESDIRLEIGDVEAPLTALTDDPIGTTFSTVSVDLEAAGVDAESVQDVWLTFWGAGSGAIELEEIRFAASGCEDGVEVGDYCARDTTGDGLYDDITGDGETTHEDVTTFFEHLDSDAVQGDADSFDFAGDGGAGFTDVISLFEQL